MRVALTISLILLLELFSSILYAQEEASPSMQAAQEALAADEVDDDKDKKVELNVLEETVKDAIAKYRAGCSFAADKKTLVIPEYCVPLGEKLEELDQKDGAKTAYTSGCKAGIILACVRLGTLLQETGKEKEAIAIFENACKSGDEDACNKLKKESDPWLLVWGAVILVGIVAFLLAKNIVQEESEFKAAEKLEDAEGKALAAKHGIVLKYSRPFFKRYVSPFVGTLKAKKKIREKYRKVLANSGLTAVLTPDDFFSFKLFLILGFPVLFLGVRWFMEESWPLSLIPVMAAVGFFYPDIWARGKIKRRQREIIFAMPFCVDMLALSVEAGLDFVAAMQKVIDKAKKSAMTEEFETLIKEIRVEASRAEALRNMVWRVNLIQISSFAATLIAADSVGASIGPILKNLSAEIRQKRSSEVEKAGATAATKILFPMLFLIVPAVMLVVVGPLILEFIGAQK